MGRGVICSRDGKIGWDQVVKGFKNQTWEFIVDPRGNEKLLSRGVIGSDVCLRKIILAVWLCCSGKRLAARSNQAIHCELR